LDIATTVLGRCGTGGGVDSLNTLIAARFDEDPLTFTDEEGVEVPLVELSVEDDFAVGTLPLDSFEESDVRKLALERLRRSLKNGMVIFCSLVVLQRSYGHGVGSPDAGTRFRSGRQGYGRPLAGREG
jgi:hypothetical protein